MPIKKHLQYINFSFNSHKNKQIIQCHFPNDVKLIANFRNQFSNAKWSQSLKTWYLPDMPSLRTIIGLSHQPIGNTAIAKIHPINQAAYSEMQNKLLLKAYSINTQKVYLSEFAQFLYLIKSVNASQFNPKRLKSYLLYCVNTLKLSEANIHSRLNALKFYYEQVLGRSKFFCDIPRPKKPSKLPKVLSSKDIAKLFQVTTNPKHKLMLQLCYGMGLRVSEVVNLKLSDFDSKRMKVLIEKSKGKKDRYVALPKSIISQLSSYYYTYKPQHYLFEGQFGGQYASRSVQAVFKTAMHRAKINKPIGIHSLRHSYATHLLEYGTDIAYIQKLLGHQDVSTTLIYAKVGDKKAQNIESPLDRITKN